MFDYTGTVLDQYPQETLQASVDQTLDDLTGTNLEAIREDDADGELLRSWLMVLVGQPHQTTHVVDGTPVVFEVWAEPIQFQGQSALRSWWRPTETTAEESRPAPVTDYTTGTGG